MRLLSRFSSPDRRSRASDRWWTRFWSHRLGDRVLPVVWLSVGQSTLLASLVVAGGMLILRSIGGFQSIELSLYDQLVRLQPDLGEDPRMLVVAITESDIQAKDSWPLPDETLARLLQTLQQHQPKVIGLDLHRNIPQEPGTGAFREQLKADNVITIKKLGNPDVDGVPQIPGIPSQRVGFNDFLVDPDNRIRRNFLYAYEGDSEFYSLALRLSLKYLDASSDTFRVADKALWINGRPISAIQSNFGGYRTIDAAGYQTMLRYRSPSNAVEQVSLKEVLNQGLKPEQVRDRIVLIGTTAPSRKDIFVTPFSWDYRQTTGESPGVLLHAQQTSQILDIALGQRHPLWAWPEGVEAVWIWFWGFVGGGVIWRLQQPLRIGLGIGLSLGVLSGSGLIAFGYGGWIPLAPPAVALVVTSGAVLTYRLRYATFHHAPTNLPNRHLFLQYTQWTIVQCKHQRTRLFAVLFLSLDQWEVVSNTLGHQASDYLLISAARRLRRTLRSQDVLAQVSSGEFAILLDNLSNTEDATQVADRLHQQMSTPFSIQGQEVFAGLNIGIALNQTDYDYRPEDLLRDAHTAMYRAKALGKSRHEVFSAGLRMQIMKRMQIETDLRRAIEQQQIQLHYQPIVRLCDRQLAGFEALVRWFHPEHGYIPPGVFIPVAEETGMINRLGLWILRHACQQLAQWQAAYPNGPALIMSVNLSSHQLSQSDLVEQVAQILQETQIPGHSLKLEITESAAMSDAEATINLLLRLKALKVRLSIDDFGTGYSSLSYLHRFPVDMLKVDRSFVSRMGCAGEDAAIVQTILVLAKTLGLDVIAEGIETIEQAESLRELECTYGQGYLFSKPLDSRAATEQISACQTQP